MQLEGQICRSLPTVWLMGGSPCSHGHPCTGRCLNVISNPTDAQTPLGEKNTMESYFNFLSSTTSDGLSSFYSFCLFLLPDQSSSRKTIGSDFKSSTVT
jgi:hypothetical protein